MKPLLFTTLTLFIATILYGQINIEDSTVQVVGYWYKGDTQSYTISDEKYKVNGADTTDRSFFTYDVDILIKDSTADSYTIEWKYSNYKTDSSENIFLKKILSIFQDLTVEMKMNEMGGIIEVINWKQIQEYANNAFDILQKELKDIPNIDAVLQQAKSSFSSQEAIQANAIKDAIQYYNYHGGKYKLGETLTSNLQLQNNYGGAPFDTDIQVVLDEINTEEGNSILKMFQSVDSKQLTDATYDYLVKMSKSMDLDLQPRDTFPPLKNETFTGSRIHGETGWVIYSIETKEVFAEGIQNIEERIIMLK